MTKKKAARMNGLFFFSREARSQPLKGEGPSLTGVPSSNFLAKRVGSACCPGGCEDAKHPNSNEAAPKGGLAAL